MQNQEIQLEDYENLLYKICHSFNRTTGIDFEELKSAAYEGFCGARNTYKAEKSCFSTWLTHVVRSTIIHELIDRRKHAVLDFYEDLPEPKGETLLPFTMADLLDRVEHLKVLPSWNGKKKKLIQMYFVEGMTEKEIAQEFKCKTQYINQSKLLILKALKKNLIANPL